MTYIRKPRPKMSREFKEAFGKIYFVEAPSVGLIKIGYATDILQRMQGLATFSPVELRLLGTLSGGPSKEQELHAALDEHRSHGEWFRRCAEIEALIETLDTSMSIGFIFARRRGDALQAYLAKMKAGEVVRPTRGPTRTRSRTSHWPA